MKLQAILIFVLTFSPGIVFAQTAYGVRAGTNVANQHRKINPPGYSAETIETKVYPGFQIGAFFNYNIHNEFSLATELNFSLLGSKTKYTRTDFIVNPDGSISGATSGYYNDKIYQLEIPLFIKYNINRISMGIGPMVGIKLSSTINDYQDSNFKNTYYRPIDFGINAMMDYSLNKRLGLNVKYNYGVTDNDEREYSVVKNRYLCFAITYIL